MGDIFTPWRLGGLALQNRLVRSATYEGLAEPDGTPKIELANLLGDLAEGGVGLIITGYAYVRADGLGLPNQTGVYIDAQVGPLARVSDAVHRCGGKVALQIVHAGGQSKPEWHAGHQLIGPSAIVHPAFGAPIAAMTKDQIADIIDCFGRAAARAKAAGFDGVQLHGAHGYLINQFLSPNTNLRDDEYGGDIDGRARFCLEAYQAARQAVGPDYPVFIKLGSHDAVEGGLTLADALHVARRLDAMGVDAIEVSGGVIAAGKNSPSRLVKGPEQEGYFLAEAKAIKAAVQCPVISVGGWRTRPRIEQALDAIDAVAICRPLVRQPDLPRRWAQGSDESPTCVSCGKCIGVAMRQGLACALDLAKED